MASTPSRLTRLDSSTISTKPPPNKPTKLRASATPACAKAHASKGCCWIKAGLSSTAKNGTMAATPASVVNAVAPDSSSKPQSCRRRRRPSVRHNLSAVCTCTLHRFAPQHALIGRTPFAANGLERDFALEVRAYGCAPWRLRPRAGARKRLRQRRGIAHRPEQAGVAVREQRVEGRD